MSENGCYVIYAPDLDRALDVIEELVREYSLLLLARDGDIVPVWTCPGLVDTYPLREEGGHHAQDTSAIFR
jgi:hypothetical protein